MKAINVLLALLVSLAMGLGILEVGLRVLGRGPERPLVAFDPVTGWSNRANAVVKRKTGEFRIKLETNALGLRDDPMASPAKPEGVYRIVALGDSFTLGFAVDREDHFVDLLEADRRAEGQAVEVLNVGTEGWDTAQQAAWLEQNAALYEPDLVILLPYENDLYWNAQAAYTARNGERAKPRFAPDGTREAIELVDPGPKPWLERFALTNWLAKTPADASAEHRFEVVGAAGPLEAELIPLLEAAHPGLVAVRDHTRGALRAAQAAVDAAGSELLVVPIPSGAAFEPAWKAIYDDQRGLAGVAWSPDRPVDFVLGLTEELGLEAFDPRPAMRAVDAAEGSLYRETDFHLSPLGSRVLAGALAERLDSAVGSTAAPSVNHERSLAFAATSPPSGGIPTWAKLFGGLWVALSGFYMVTYKDEENVALAPLKVGALLGVVLGTFLGIAKLSESLPPSVGANLPILFAVGILGFVFYKLGDRLGTIFELLKSFVLRGHWYLMPLVVVLLSIGSLLVVAASSPLVAPFIYTLF